MTNRKTRIPILAAPDESREPMPAYAVGDVVPETMAYGTRIIVHLTDRQTMLSGFYQGVDARKVLELKVADGMLHIAAARILYIGEPREPEA